jgi:translation initiation factor IF-2
MPEENNKEAVETTTKVVEKRLKPTLIRRRKKEVKEPKEPAPAEAAEAMAEAAEAGAAVPAAEGAPPPEGVAEAGAEGAQAASAPAAGEEEAVVGPDGKLLAKPSEAEKQIGVVGYIELKPTEPTERAREDWREKFKRTPKRRRSKAEMEMEAIQRAGGLKQYAERVETDETVPPGTPQAMADRVFQPTYTGKKRRPVRRDFKKTALTEAKAIKKVIRIEEGISVSALSQAVGIKAGEIIKKLMDLGIMATVNQQVDVDTATLIAEEHGFKVEHTAFKEEEILVEPEAHASAENFEPRAPVVTVMGHVDHGKTSILDVIRKSAVAEGEAGGITQHMGAYEVKHSKGVITFLDTPGHEAFTMMRARGAQVTDLVILVVAADDGIMPQTVEAISHSKAAGVPIIVAINKIDKADAQPDRVRQSLTEYGLVPEEWGGDILCVNTSAKTKEGIDQLLETVLLQSEMLELKADPTIRAKGVVVEASLHKGRGPIATVLIQEGTLNVGDYIVCGAYDGKVRAMFDAAGKKMKVAGPSKPAVILGLSGVPGAGDEMVMVTDDRAARLVAEQRRQKERERDLVRPVHVSLEDLAKQMEQGETKELPVVLKADVQGSLEAVGDALTKLSTQQVKLNIIHSAVGGISENDVMLATASDAVVLGFNVVADVKAKQAAEHENIDVRTYRVIYEMIDQVRKAMEGLLAPEEKEVALGQAEVREVFKISKVGTIAGCHVILGKVLRNANARLIRDQVVVFEGKFSSLKRFKDDVREVAEGYECGIGLDGFNDIKSGDIIEAFQIEKKAVKLL